jgi:hypothetical protein
VSAAPTRKLVPDDPDLAAEGWVVIDDRGLWLLWTHTPSFRSVVVEAREGVSVVLTTRHDELGNPIEDGSHALREFALFGEALQAGRAVRRSILAERNDVTIADQLPLRPADESGGAS